MLQLDSNNMAATGTSVIEQGRIDDSVEKSVGPVNLQTSEDSGLQQKSENEAENKSSENENVGNTNSQSNNTNNKPLDSSPKDSASASGNSASHLRISSASISHANTNNNPNSSAQATPTSQNDSTVGTHSTKFDSDNTPSFLTLPTAIAKLSTDSNENSWNNLSKNQKAAVADVILGNLPPQFISRSLTVICEILEQGQKPCFVYKYDEAERLMSLAEENNSNSNSLKNQNNTSAVSNRQQNNENLIIDQEDQDVQIDDSNSGINQKISHDQNQNQAETLKNSNIIEDHQNNITSNNNNRQELQNFQAKNNGLEELSENNALSKFLGQGFPMLGGVDLSGFGAGAGDMNWFWVFLVFTRMYE